jgi:formate dehydrogenase major subunit
VNLRKTIEAWPVLRQLRGGDRLGLGEAARSARSASLEPRTAEADRVVRSICPYCAVGCGQRVFVKDDQVIQIEGDPDSPISRGRLCPKGSASKQLVTSPGRVTTVRYRRPYGTDWEELPPGPARCSRTTSGRVTATTPAAARPTRSCSPPTGSPSTTPPGG